MNQLPVLVVASSNEVREALVELLYTQGFEVHGASNGDDALGVLGSHRRRWLIVLDLDPAGADGWAFLDALSVFEVPADTFRVLVISAHPAAQTLRRRETVHGILPSPFDVPTLLSTVRELAAVSHRR